MAASSLRKATEKLPEQLNVLNLGGVVGGQFRTQSQIKHNILLDGPSFVTRCPIPDVRPNTKILAICGITDAPTPGTTSNGQADPREDGWFFSDFFLYHHLLKPVSSDQVWMACVSPKNLVDKYTEYLHGNANLRAPVERRIVLNKKMLPEVADVRVVPARELLDRFISTLSESIAIARREDRPLLVMIFAHGDDANESFVIGGNGSESSPKLTKDHFRRAIGNRLDTGICLFTTACFSGAWAVNPNLNVTTMASAKPWEESLAWPLSGSVNRRYCGSPYATSIAKALCEMTIEDNTDIKDDYTQHPTYAGFVKVIMDILATLTPSAVTPGTVSTVKNTPMFSAQNDEWEMSYTKRTGLPLNVFAQRYSLLKAAGSKPQPPGGEYRFGPGKVLSYDQLLSTVKREVKYYMNSYPGPDNTAKNVPLHGAIHGILKLNERPEMLKLADWHMQIEYRMNQIMVAATLYKEYLEIQMPDCQRWDSTRYPLWGEQPWIQVYELVRTYPLFDRPPTGHMFMKGYEYIAACIVTAGWSRQQAVAKLDSLVKYRNNKVPGSGVSIVPGTSTVMYNIEKRELLRTPTIRQSLRTISQATSKRLRSMSPVKHRRGTIPSEWTGQEN
ncbi:hypothetical protein B7463_g1573, partial [Scytalidium lignicola]